MKGKAASKMPAHKMPNGGMMAGKSHPKDMPMMGAMPKGMPPKDMGKPAVVVAIGVKKAPKKK